MIEAVYVFIYALSLSLSVSLSLSRSLSPKQHTFLDLAYMQGRGDETGKRGFIK